MIASDLLRNICECAGARFLGLQDDCVSLQDPETLSGVSIPIRDIRMSEEPVKVIMRALDESRRKFRRAG